MYCNDLSKFVKYLCEQIFRGVQAGQNAVMATFQMSWILYRLQDESANVGRVYVCVCLAVSFS